MKRALHSFRLPILSPAAQILKMTPTCLCDKYSSSHKKWKKKRLWFSFLTFCVFSVAWDLTLSPVGQHQPTFGQTRRKNFWRLYSTDANVRLKFQNGCKWKEWPKESQGNALGKCGMKTESWVKVLTSLCCPLKLPYHYCWRKTSSLKRLILFSLLTLKYD